MTYVVELTAVAEKQFKKLGALLQRQLGRKISELEQNPFPSGVVKLSGEESIYRIRSGDYRILYSVVESKLLVLVVKVGHRREVYR